MPTRALLIRPSLLRAVALAHPHPCHARPPPASLAPVHAVPSPKHAKSSPVGSTLPVRAWSRLGGKPPVIARGEGAWLEDVDGRRYVDYVLSWGPLIHGHAHPAIVKAITETAAKGTSFGAPTGAETALADLIRSALPGCQQVRMVSSGTEATMSALRLARAATGRDLIIKCDGCYHGHADHLLVAAGSGAATFGQPDSAGVPAAFAEQTLVAPFNDAAAIERLLTKHRGRVAAVIIEPVAGNMGLVPPEPGYLKALRQACTAAGTLLIFDEVMTGFRTAWGGYQCLAKVRPDLTCLGKVIGGGLPAAAYAGKRDVMRHLAPEGPCYQAGTLSGNPVAVAAGLATLRLAKRAGFYDRLSARLARLITRLRPSPAVMQCRCASARLAPCGDGTSPIRQCGPSMMPRQPIWMHGNVSPERCWPKASIWHPVRSRRHSSGAHDRAAIAHTVAAADHAFAAAAG